MLYALLKVAHVVCVFMLISGMVGRGLVRARIPQLSEFGVFQELVKLDGRFDRLVIQGSQLTLLSGIIVAIVGRWPLFAHGHPTGVFVSLILFLSTLILVIFVYAPRGKRFGQKLEAATSRQQITDEVRAEFYDRVVTMAHSVEFVIIGVVLILMVTKPF